MEADPFKLFDTWFDRAKNTSSIDKPNAMTLATVDGQHRPSARIVLLSSVDQRGFVFHTNYLSHKGKELESNPAAALVFWWDELGYQIRISGDVVKTSETESDRYFAGRPRGSQLGAWASEQSHEISDRAVLDERVSEFTKRFENQDVPRPPHWGGYRLVPYLFEFWENRDNRLHDRYRYVRQQDGSWRQSRLAP